MKNKFVAWILALLLWSIGFHKFYLGKWVQWIFYMLFVFTWIPTFISILEGVLYLFNTKSRFDIKYNAEWIKTQNELNNIYWNNQ